MATERLEPYRAVREEVGLIDRSEVGKLALTGPDRLTWLQGMVSNDTRVLAGGGNRVQACVLDPTGHVMSDLALIAVPGNHPLTAALGLPAADFVLAELPRTNVAKIMSVFDRLLIMEDVEIADMSEALGCFSLQGPQARQAAEKFAGGNILAVPADHTGSGGMDLYFPAPEAAVVRARLTDAGIVAVGEEEEEVLRVEAGIPQYDADIDESVIALEANLGPTHISLAKGCYVGQEIIARIDSRGHTNRALTGLIVQGEKFPAPGDKIFTLPTSDEPSERETGRITSVAAWSPAAGGRPIALGYVRHEHRAPGTPLQTRGEGGETLLTVTELPFYRAPAR